MRKASPSATTVFMSLAFSGASIAIPLIMLCCCRTLAQKDDDKRQCNVD
jgi:hypothetical protein